MNLEEALPLLEQHRLSRKWRELRLVVEVYSPGSVGGTPCVPVKALEAGFDWDSGKIILSTDQPLTTLSSEQAAAILESVRKGQSWHAYQREKKHQTEKLELKQQRDELLAALVAISRLAGNPLKDFADALEIADNAIVKMEG
jgi:hypothetical protein